jgi:poly(A) polymerase
VTDEPALLLSPPPEFLADPALQAVLAALPTARLVGGCVRDAVAGRTVADFDLATPDQPDSVMQAVRAAGLKAVPTGIAHGTVTVVSQHRGFEVTTLRRDVATDGRHAVVAWTDDWRQDAARRDFTINAMSMTRDAAVFDYFGGIADLRARLVRFVGDPAQRLAEDRLRVLRFFRFQARYGSEPAEPAAVAAIANEVDNLAALSAERIWSELKRILAVPDPAAVIRLMDRLGVLAALLPGEPTPHRLLAMLAIGVPPDPLLRLAALSDAAPDLTAQTFRLSLAEARTLADLCVAPLATPAHDEDARRRLLTEWPADILIGRTWLACGAGPAWDALRAMLAATPRPVFPLAGRDAVAAGIPPGPKVGEALRQVRAWWLAGGCRADTTSCRARLRLLSDDGHASLPMM